MNRSIQDEIKGLVSNSSTSDALAMLLELSQPNKQVHDAIHIVLGEFNDLTSQRLRGTIDNSEATRRLNIIHEKILIALNSFDSQGKPLPGQVIVGSKNAFFLKKYGLINLVICISFAFICLLINLTMAENVDKSKIVTGGLITAGIIAYVSGFLSIILIGGWLLSIIVNALRGR